MTIATHGQSDSRGSSAGNDVVPMLRISSFPGLLRAALLITLGFSLLTHGAVDHGSASALSFMLGGIAMLSMVVPVANRSASRLLAGLSLCALGLVVFVVFQSLRMPATFLDHPAWQIIRDQIGPVSGAVSVAPGQSLAALPALAPVLGGLILLRVASDQADAMFVLKCSLVIGYSVALIGLAQQFWFPTSMLFTTKTAYLGSLTAVFVNRNSAGTFLGVTALVSLGLCLFHLRQVDLKRFFGSTHSDPLRQPLHLQLALYGAGTVLTMIALLLTQSRGAILSTLAAVIVMVSILSAWRFTKSSSSGQPSYLRRMRPWLMIGGVLAVFLMFGGKVTQRLEDEGTDAGRICVYKSSLQAAKDNWPLGSGFGTFQQVFPAYRDSQCPGINGVWEAAHNSYLEGLMGLGVAFPIVVAGVVGFLITAYVRGLRERRRFRFAPAAGIAILTLVLLHAALDFSLQVPGIALYVAMLLACCAAVSIGREPAMQKTTPSSPPKGA